MPSAIFSEVLWTDLGKIIGRQGMNLKIIKAESDRCLSLSFYLSLSRPHLLLSAFCSLHSAFCILLCQASIGCEIQVPRQEKAKLLCLLQSLLPAIAYVLRPSFE